MAGTDGAQGQAPASAQPGGGVVVVWEQAWARLRRRFLRRFYPDYVRESLARRQGDCPACPHDIIDSRDLKYTRPVCGYFFAEADDPFAWRYRLGFAPHGFAEMAVGTLACLFVGLVGAAAAVFIHGIFWLVAATALVFWLEIVWFFRDPERNVPADPRCVVSPADGVITQIEEVDDPTFPGGRARRISIFLSIFNVHVNRQPLAGVVENVRYFPGEFLDARHAECARRNEQLWIDMRTAATPAEADSAKPAVTWPVRVKAVSGAIARRIVCWVKTGDCIPKGDRIGMIKFGSRTDLLIAPEAVETIHVQVGDAVLGAETVLFTLRKC